MTLDRALLKKGFFILIILAVAPFAFEVVLLADVARAEFAVFFLIYYLKTTVYIILQRWLEFKRSVFAACRLCIYAQVCLADSQPPSSAQATAIHLNNMLICVPR